MTDLDISWIEEIERIQNISENPTKELSKSITTCFIYINLHNVVDSVHYEHFSFHDGSNNIITREQLLDIGQQKKKKTPVSKFIMKQVLLYHVDFEPGQILGFSQCNEDDIGHTTKHFLHSYHTLDSISIEPSIFVFHDINTLYFLFYEEESNETKKTKSILKSSLPYSQRHQFTKRVKIKTPRFTRKTHL